MLQKRPLFCFTHLNRYIPGGYDQKYRSSVLFRRGAESYDEAYFESLSKSAEEPDHPRGLDMMIKLPWNRGVRPNRPKPMVNLRLMELETATDHRGNLPRQALGRDGDDPDEKKSFYGTFL